MIDHIGSPYERTRLARTESGEGLQSFTRIVEALHALGVEVTATMTIPETTRQCYLRCVKPDVIGFCCFGAEARVIGQTAMGGVLDIGGGVRPGQTERRARNAVVSGDPRLCAGQIPSDAISDRDRILR